jgi:hypothetical protein
MEFTDRLPVELLTTDTNLMPLFYLLIVVPTVLGAAYHIDHIVRGNHVGWPVT